MIALLAMLATPAGACVVNELPPVLFPRNGSVVSETPTFLVFGSGWDGAAQATRVQLFGATGGPVPVDAIQVGGVTQVRPRQPLHPDAWYQLVLWPRVRDLQERVPPDILAVQVHVVANAPVPPPPAPTLRGSPVRTPGQDGGDCGFSASFVTFPIPSSLPDPIYGVWRAGTDAGAPPDYWVGGAADGFSIGGGEPMLGEFGPYGTVVVRAFDPASSEWSTALEVVTPPFPEPTDP